MTTARSLLLAATLLALSSVVRAQGRLWVVDDGPYAADFATIQAAIDAAGDGDSILLRPGSYDGFVVDGKSLAIVAEEPGQVVLPADLGATAIRVVNLAPGQTVVIRGVEAVRAHGEDLDTEATAVLRDNQGLVLLEDCALLAVRSAIGSELDPSGRALRVRDSQAAVAVRCELLGGVYALDAELALYDCALRAGDGVQCHPPVPATPGRPALEIDGGSAFLSGCTLVGGTGGDGAPLTSCCPADGAPALLLDQGAPTVHLRDTELVPGEPGGKVDCGLTTAPATVVVTGAVVAVPGAGRTGFAHAFALEGELLRFTHVGEPGDVAFVGLSVSAAPLWLPPIGLVTPSTAGLVVLLPGVVGDGPLLTDVPVPALPAALPLHAQSWFVAPTGAGTLGGPDLTVLADLGDPASGDCNGDGTADLLQILEGQLADDDLDGVPNVCESLTRLYVDDDAPGDPGPGDPLVSDPLEDGTLAHPFDALQEAVDASVPAPYTVVLVADGTYRGPGNREVDLGGRDLTIRSASGAAACVVDCEEQGRAFVFAGGETPRARLSGLTVVNGRAGEGGAVLIEGSDPTIEDCVFRDNAAVAALGAGSGGAIHASDSSALLARCTFEGNAADESGGAVRLYGELPVGSAWSPHGDVTTIEDCRFSGNAASYEGGAIDAYADNSYQGARLLLRRSTLEDNTAQWGGALALQMTGAVLDSALIGNAASFGGGVYVGDFYWWFGDGGATLQGCTIVDNQASGFGGGLTVDASYPWVLIDRTILWGNDDTSSTVGDQIHASGTPVTVRFSDVQGGAAGVGGIGPVSFEEGNLDADPLLAGPGDPHLLPGSPCLDAGDPADVPGLLERDLDGDPRRLGPRVDVGADEAQLP